MNKQIKKFQNIEKYLSKAKGKFELFALFLRENAPNKWDLLISSDWARVDKKASIDLIAKEVQKELLEEELLMLSRIIILDKNDDTLSSIQGKKQIENGLSEISGIDFLGLAIKHGYLINS
ncbi:hypothetical protein MHK_008891 [Candidatus Magnetomorum sp. HK-1]|nr:hypothetical protein MHK_008891 [Candidatus Magnetomorum sp. HK-1]